MPTSIFQLFKKEFPEPLSDTINIFQSRCISYTKHILNIAIVIPFHKNGDKIDCNNYGAVSVLSSISKMFEKSLHICQIDFVRKNKLFFCDQFGCGNGYSVNHALFSLTELIRKALDENKFVLGVFSDLKKAFNTVDHNILLSKLYHYGVEGAPHQQFKSYLTGNQQCTTINHQKSSLSSFRYSVLQGSILGLQLFLLYINDLRHHFARYTNFLYASHSLKSFITTINFSLSYLVQWLRQAKYF